MNSRSEADRTVTRERVLTAAFVALSDTLVNDFDVVELLGRLVATAVQVLGADGAGLLLGDQRGSLQVMASSDEQIRLLELLELQSNDGPCLDSYLTGVPIPVTVLDAAALTRWPTFTPAARRAGYNAVQAMPMRLRTQTIGSLNVLYSDEHPVRRADDDVVQALADVATIGILQQRAVVRADTLAAQLQAALNSRLVIEQVKGLLAERAGMSVGEAFEILRRYCRARQLRVSDVARDVVLGQLDADDVLADRWPESPESGWS